MLPLLKLAWFDLETTGLPPLEHVDVLEIAVVQQRPHSQAVRMEYQDLIKPPRPIPVSASQANGIYEKDVYDKPSFKEIAHMIFTALDGHVWAGHNIRRFDIPLLLLEFERAGIQPPASLGVFDTLEFARQHFAGRPGLDNCRLQTLALYFGLLEPKAKQKHRALEDVHLNIKVAQCMLAQVYLEQNLFPVCGLSTSPPVKLSSTPQIAASPDLKPSSDVEEKHSDQPSRLPARCIAITQPGTRCKKRVCADGKIENLCGTHLKMLRSGKELIINPPG